MRARVCSAVVLTMLITGSAYAQEPEKGKSDPSSVTLNSKTKLKPVQAKLVAQTEEEINEVVSEQPRLANPESVTPLADSQRGGGTGSNFMDTRLTWTFGDDDILNRTGTTQPLSPLPYVGDRPQYRLFFDNLNSRFTGRENLTHLVMYKKMPGFIENLDTEAALVLRFDMQSLAAQNNNLNQALYDTGSYIRLFYRTGGTKATPHGLGLVFFPLDTDRFRLGYLYDISWGGTNRNESIFPKLQGSSPGFKIQYDTSHGIYVFAGMKTAQIPQSQTILRPGSTNATDVERVIVSETNYGFLLGGGADVGDWFHADIGGGYFQQGRFEAPDLQPLPGQNVQAPQVFTYGASARLVVHKNMPTPQSVDFMLYRNDPNAPMMLFKPEIYKAHELAYSLSLEGTQLNQNLHNPSQTGGTIIQPARAAALQGILKAGFSRISLAAIYRDLPFVLRNVPSVVPFDALPKDNLDVTTNSEFFVAASFDYYFDKLRLKPGLSAGVQLPAAFTSTLRTTGNAPVNNTFVVRQQGDVSILPRNEGRKPILQTRLSLRWDLSEILSAIGWVQWVHDPVRTLVARNPQEGTVGIRTFQSTNFLGFGVTLQARY